MRTTIEKEALIRARNQAKERKLKLRAEACAWAKTERELSALIDSENIEQELKEEKEVIAYWTSLPQEELNEKLKAG